jgi:hypothetical protein
MAIAITKSNINFNTKYLPQMEVKTPQCYTLFFPVPKERPKEAPFGTLEKKGKDRGVVTNSWIRHK